MSNPDKTAGDRAPGSSSGAWVLRALAAVGLAVDGYVHLTLASRYDGNAAISQGTLFRVEAVLAAIALVLILLFRRRASAVLAAVVAGGGLIAVLVYLYVDIGAFGPFPDMYDPGWFPEKIFSAAGQALATLASLLLLLPASTHRAATVGRANHHTS